jgi:hypothetical protein
MENAVFWDVMPCGSCKSWCFGGTYHLHHQDDKNQWARNNLAVTINWSTLRRYTMSVGRNTMSHTYYFFTACSSCYLLLSFYLAFRFLSPWWWRRYVAPKRRFLQGPHQITSQKTAFFVENLAFRKMDLFLSSGEGRGTDFNRCVHWWWWWLLLLLCLQRTICHPSIFTRLEFGLITSDVVLQYPYSLQVYNSLLSLEVMCWPFSGDYLSIVAYVLPSWYWFN